MSLSNRVFNFVKSKVEAAEIGEVLHGTMLHANLYEKFDAKSSKWIRIGDVQQSVPVKVAGVMTERDAFLTLQFLKRPASQKLDDLLSARAEASAMALEIAGFIFDDRKIENNACTAKVERKTDDWRDIGGGFKTPVSYLLLKLNF